MEKQFKASLEIVYFECNDIITTSLDDENNKDHDNGYADSGDFANLLENQQKRVKKFLIDFFYTQIQLERALLLKINRCAKICTPIFLFI